MIEQLLSALKGISDLPETEERKLRSLVYEQKLSKGEVFIQEGTVPQKFAFVVKGLFRYYYINEKGSEFTKGFFPENTFITSYSAMTDGIPSHYTIEALEDAVIFVFEYSKWKVLYNAHLCWREFLLALLEKGFRKKETRERELLLLSAEERYRSFLREKPALENRIKQHLIASYLGITPVALSRIRRNMDN
ncbi:MAG TPA: Crp/Fnr family transcriptional regulator [Ohtaekwangia sp.]|nr:Crp/Fnr family transcriptional regulator [Ohtaekwangia sp.]